MTGLKAQAPKLPSYALDDVRELAALAWRAPDADYFACMLDLQLLPLQSGGFAVTSAYDLLVVRALKDSGDGSIDTHLRGRCAGRATRSCRFCRKRQA